MCDIQPEHWTGDNYAYHKEQLRKIDMVYGFNISKKSKRKAAAEAVYRSKLRKHS